MSETELLQAFRKERSEEAFAELVRRYAGLVFSVARRRLSSAALAEDVTQLVFIRFAKTPPKVKSAGELAAWLHRTTLNVTIDTWRSESRRRHREQQAAVMQPETTTSTQAFWDEISPSLDEAIDQLNDEDRQAILLRFFKAKPMRDVGAALGVSEAAAKMRVGRAVEKLRTQLGTSAAATTAVVLAGVLEGHSAEAAPVQLVSRLAAMKLPAAGVAGTSGFHSLSRISRVKLAAGAIGLAVVAILLAHFARSNAPVAKATTPASNEIAPAPRRIAQLAPQSAPAQTDVPALALPKGVKIQFHVLDADTGAGLGQTKIRFVYFGAGGQGEGHETVTDDKGGAAITEPDDPSKNWGPNVFVTAEGHVPKAVSFRTTPPAEYTIKLESATTASGTVIDEQGAPVPGVSIAIASPGNVPGQMENIDFQTCPVTNHEDGTWSCSYIPRDYTNILRLTLNKPGYAATDITVPVSRVGLSDLTLIIDRGYTITGRVTNAQGDPINSAKVKVLGGDYRKPQSARSDENGVFVLTGVRGEATTNQRYVSTITVPDDKGIGILYGMSQVDTNESGGAVLHGVAFQGPLEADLAVEAAGFAAQTKTVALSAATNTADFVLAAGNIFRGQVVDEAGNPISNAVVQTDFDFDGQVQNGVEKSRPRFDWTSHTDASGWFQWNSAPSQEICYWFEADGYVPIRGLKLAADGSEHRIVLKSKQ